MNRFRTVISFTQETIRKDKPEAAASGPEEKYHMVYEEFTAKSIIGCALIGTGTLVMVL